MAALDGKITIGIDYRPCIVHIPAVMRNRRKDLNVYREVVEPEKYIRALFHCWSHRSEIVGESYLRGGHSAGQVSSTFAIVEYEDGTVHEVEPWSIQFVDNVMSEYELSERKKNVSWFCFADNPAIRGYRNFIKKHGGIECAYHRQVAKLQDGKLHDSVEFEILASEFKK